MSEASKLRTLLQNLQNVWVSTGPGVQTCGALMLTSIPRSEVQVGKQICSLFFGCIQPSKCFSNFVLALESGFKVHSV